ncbi:MAG: DnaB family ATPase, partial [Candidatus Kryptonium sp.]
INLFLKKLGNIFINYSYENAVTFMGREEDEPEDTILSLDFRDKNQVNLIVDRLGTYGASERVYSSGFKNFDMRFLNGGFEPGRIYIFAGKPGQGKSALLLNFAYNAALKESENGAVLYITLENSVEETINRLLKILVYDVTGNREAYKDIRKDKQKMKDILLKHFSDKRFIIKYFHPNFPTSDLLSWIATLQQKEKISIIFIDYLSLLTSTKAYEQKRHELGQITLELKKMSRIFNVPIVTAAQLNTAGYDIIPTMKNIDESRQVAQHADFIGLLFDDKTDSNLNLIDECQMVLGINIDKNRNGPRGIARFLFDSLTMKLKEITKTGEKIVVAQNDDIEEIIKEEDHNIMDIEEVSDLLQEDPLGNI